MATTNDNVLHLGEVMDIERYLSRLSGDLAFEKTIFLPDKLNILECVINSILRIVFIFSCDANENEDKVIVLNRLFDVTSLVLSFDLVNNSRRFDVKGVSQTSEPKLRAIIITGMSDLPDILLEASSDFQEQKTRFIATDNRFAKIVQAKSSESDGNFSIEITAPIYIFLNNL